MQRPSDVRFVALEKLPGIARGWKSALKTIVVLVGLLLGLLDLAQDRSNKFFCREVLDDSKVSSLIGDPDRNEASI